MTNEEAIKILKSKMDGNVDTSYEWAETVRMAIKALKQPEPKWIPCSERLPEDDTEVFIYLFEPDSPYIAWVCNCRWYTEEFEVEEENYPKAWMPLPAPYKGES